MEESLRNVLVSIAAQWLNREISEGTAIYQAIDVAVRTALYIKDNFGVSDEDIDAFITEFSEIQ